MGAPVMQAPMMQAAPSGMMPQGMGAQQGGGGFDSANMQKEVDTEILVEKEQTIHELRDTVEILEMKIKKLEQLVRLKDRKIATMSAKLTASGINVDQ